MFGSGWVAAEDRGLLLRIGLGPAYAAADGIPGINPFQLLLSARGFTPSAQSLEFVNEQQKVLLEQGPEGEQVLHDLENWVKGVNAFEKTLPPIARIPTATVGDAIAGFSLIGSIFGNGGGNEVTNSQFLARLQAKLGAKPGANVFRDLREVNDPEAATTISTPFPYDQQPTGPTPGAVVIDPGSVSSSAAAASAAAQESKSRPRTSCWSVAPTPAAGIRWP